MSDNNTVKNDTVIQFDKVEYQKSLKKRAEVENEGKVEASESVPVVPTTDGNGKMQKLILIGGAILGFILLTTTATELYQNHINNKTVNNITYSTTEMIENLNSMNEGLGTMKETVKSNEYILTEMDVDKSDGTGGVVKSLQDINSDINLSQEQIEALLETLNGSTELTQSQYDSIVNQYDEISKNVNTITTDMNSVINNIDGNIKDLSSQNNKNYKDTIDKLSSVQDSLTQSTNTFEANMTNQLGTLSENIDKGNKEIKNNISSLSDSTDKNYKDMQSLMQTNQTNMSTSISNNQATLETTLDANNQEIIDALNNNYNNLDNKVSEVFQCASNGKYMLVSTLLAKYNLVGASWTIGSENASSVSLNGISYNDIADGIRNLPTSVTLQPDDSNIITYYHHHTFGTKADGSPIYKSDIEAYCDEHDIPYSFGSDMTFYCETNPSTIVNDIGGDGSSTCYESAGHTHSSTSAGSSDNNVKYTGHHCTWENYTYTSTCGGSSRCSGKGDSWCPSCENNGGGYTLTCTKCGNSWHSHATSGSCPKGTTKTGQRYTCGSPVNTWKPTKCGFSEGQVVYRDSTYHYKDEPSTGSTSEDNL